MANFLKYVDAGLYDGGRFHRTVRTRPDNQPQSEVRIDVIQASSTRRNAFPAIPLERTSVTGLKHTDGALSMARDALDSATSDFFICIGDQPSLDYGGKRNPDGQGFAVFGRVTNGMDVVRKIQQSRSEEQRRLMPPVKILSNVARPPGPPRPDLSGRTSDPAVQGSVPQQLRIRSLPREAPTCGHSDDWASISRAPDTTVKRNSEKSRKNTPNPLICCSVSWRIGSTILERLGVLLLNGKLSSKYE